MSVLTEWSQAIQQTRTFAPKLIRHVRLHGMAWLLLIALLMAVQANYRIAINRTPSLPYRVYLVCLGDAVPTDGFIAFTWHHGKPFPDGTVFTKRLLASAGEEVVRQGRDFHIGPINLHGKEHGLTGRQLFPNGELQEGVNQIPPGKYFVGGDHAYSLDSRYNLLGLVDQKDVIGRAYPIF